MTTSLLRVQNLHAGYARKPILSNISFDLSPGQNLGILGPNGGGKTTLLRCAGGILEPTAGSVHLHGRLLSSYSAKARARHMASVSCAFDGAFHATAIDYVLLGRFPWLSWLSRYSSADKQCANAVLTAAGIKEIAHSRMDSLSAGQAQLAALCRALAQIWQVHAPVLLLDEMSANLDLRHRINVSRLLACFQSRNNCAILQAMHDCNLAALYCTHLLGIKNGKMLFYGPVEKVFTAENLSELYDWPIGITPHPDLPRPQLYAHLRERDFSPGSTPLRANLRR